jgi:hypothetical protein
MKILARMGGVSCNGFLKPDHICFGEGWKKSGVDVETGHGPELSKSFIARKIIPDRRKKQLGIKLSNNKAGDLGVAILWTSRNIVGRLTLVGRISVSVFIQIFTSISTNPDPPI